MGIFLLFIPGGLLFGKIAGKVKNQIATVALVLAGIGFLLPALLHARLPIFAGGVLVGSGSCFAALPSVSAQLPVCL